ncbi:MAG TPA: hypothetical protein VNG71_14965 [Pyrinomonadaceae bacterium]|nr:hypothetical protein [Pyrinomonadaceae bacterium]
MKAWAIFNWSAGADEDILISTPTFDPVATAPGTDTLLTTITPFLTVGLMPRITRIRVN